MMPLWGPTHGGNDKEREYWWLFNRKTLSWSQPEKMTPTEARDRNEWLQKFASPWLEYVRDLDKAIAEELAP